jgi:hypothetical protein
MLKTYLDTTDSIWLDESGNFWRDGFPQLITGGHEEIEIILVKSSPGRATEAAEPETWERDTSWAGNSAMLTIDNDYRKLNRFTFAVAPAAGNQEIILVYSGNGIEIPSAGEIYLYRADGSYDAVSYSAFRVEMDILVISPDAPVPGSDYTSAAIPQLPLASAYLDGTSDLASGILRFHLAVDSFRLREIAEFADTSTVAVSGIELLFFRNNTDSTVQKIRAYLWDSVSLRNPQGDPGFEAAPPPPYQDRINSAVAEAVKNISGGLQDVVVYAAYNEDSGSNEVHITPESGKRFVYECDGAGPDDIYLTYGSGVGNVECQIWLIGNEDGGAGNWTVSFPENFGFVGEPEFEMYKSYIISIQNNVAVVCEYTPGVTA